MKSTHSNMRVAAKFGSVCILILGALSVAAQTEGDRVPVALGDPSRPATVIASLYKGGITVSGYDGKEVMVEARLRSSGGVRETVDGMKRIHASGVTVQQDGNTLWVGSDVSATHPVDITIRVPFKTSLKVKTYEEGDITVTDVEGKLDVNNTFGGVTLNNVAGWVVAHSLYKQVKVNMTRLDPDKPMSFSSMNGTIDVTFPPDLKATLNLSNDQGEVFSDFDIQILPLTHKEDSGETGHKSGKLLFSARKTLRGAINGGGPEISFKNYAGNIFIRKARQP